MTRGDVTRRDDDDEEAEDEAVSASPEDATVAAPSPSFFDRVSDKSKI